MLNLEKILKQKLKDAAKIAVLGIGSELRSDDAAGFIVATELEKMKIPKLKVFFGSTAPENLTGEIIQYSPTHIIIVDAVDMSQEPGSSILINSEEINGISFSTHMLPVKMVLDYLLGSLKCEIMIIGIQPKILAFGQDISAEVKKSAKQLSRIIQEIVKP